MPRAEKRGFPNLVMDRLAGRVQWLVRSIGATSYPEIAFKANDIARDLVINVSLEEGATVPVQQYKQELKIFPELTALGLEPPPLDFTRFVGLAHGIIDSGNVYGQLSPWPSMCLNLIITTPFTNSL